MVTDFRPLEILRVLLDEEVDFLLVGGIAVATYVTDRATGDIDIMVPTGDHSNKERLERALQRLDAQLLGTQAGHGRVPATADPEAAVELLTGRVVEADRNGRAWLSDGDLTMEVQRADLSDEHLRAWVAALHDRLRGVGLVEDEPSLEIS